MSIEIRIKKEITKYFLRYLSFFEVIRRLVMKFGFFWQNIIWHVTKFLGVVV